MSERVPAYRVGNGGVGVAAKECSKGVVEGNMLRGNQG